MASDRRDLPTTSTPTDRSLPRADGPAPDRTPPAADPASLYARVGGTPFFEALVADFYARVAEDEVLRPLYPEEDLGPAEERLRLFLIQYWGGPSTYSQERGHPRLRMRHAPFAVGTAQIEAWLRCMAAAVESADPAPAEREELLAYFVRSAHFMRNVEE